MPYSSFIRHKDSPFAYLFAGGASVGLSYRTLEVATFDW